MRTLRVVIEDVSFQLPVTILSAATDALVHQQSDMQVFTNTVPHFDSILIRVLPYWAGYMIPVVYDDSGAGSGNH